MNPVFAPLVDGLVDSRELLCCKGCGAPTSFISRHGYEPCCPNCAAAVDCYKEKAWAEAEAGGGE